MAEWLFSVDGRVTRKWRNDMLICPEKNNSVPSTIQDPAAPKARFGRFISSGNTAENGVFYANQLSNAGVW